MTTQLTTSLYFLRSMEIGLIDVDRALRLVKLGSCNGGNTRNVKCLPPVVEEDKFRNPVIAWGVLVKLSSGDERVKRRGKK